MAKQPFPNAPMPSKHALAETVMDDCHIAAPKDPEWIGPGDDFMFGHDSKPTWSEKPVQIVIKKGR